MRKKLLRYPSCLQKYPQRPRPDWLSRPTSVVQYTSEDVYRVNNFNCLRLLLATAVIFSHAYPLSSQHLTEPLAGISNGIYSLGTVAVEGFFIASGYLIAKSWQASEHWSDFAIRRILRIYPGFIFACLFCVLVVGPLASRNFDAFRAALQPMRFLYRTALLQQPILDSAFLDTAQPRLLSGSMWTIAYEAGCYFAIAIMGLVGILERRTLVAVLTGFLLFADTCLTAHHDFSRHLPSLQNGFLFNSVAAIRFSASFLVGTSAWLFRELIAYHATGSIIALATIGITFYFPPALPLIFPISMAYLIFFFVLEKPVDLSWVGRRNDLSYGVYLYAWPVEMLLAEVSIIGDSPWWLFLATLPPSVALAALSWRLVEHPAMNLKPKKQNREEPLL